MLVVKVTWWQALQAQAISSQQWQTLILYHRSPDCELPTISTGPARLDRPSAGFNRKIKKLQKSSSSQCSREHQKPTVLAFAQTLPQTQSKYKHYSLTVTWFLVHNQVSGTMNHAVNPATQSSGFMLPGLHLVGWASSKLCFANVNTDERKHLVWETCLK